MNKKVVLLSILALVFCYLGFTKDWLWFAPAVVLMILNQRILFKN